MTEEKDPSEYVEALVAPDAGVLAMARSLLESAGISYFVKNESVQSLFGWDPLGFCPSVVMVESRDAEAAKELLAALRQPPVAPADE